MDEEEVKTNPEETTPQTDSLENSQTDQFVPDIDEGNSSEQTMPETVPLKTYLELKNSHKSLKLQLAEHEDAKLNENLKAKREEVKQSWLDKGFDEMTAEAMAGEVVNIYAELGRANASKVDMIIDAEIDELSTDSLFSDIKNHKDQIKANIKKAKKLGVELSIEDAYVMAAGVRTKLKETRIKAEVTNAANNNTSSVNNNVPTASGGKPTSSYQLDSDDKAALKQLKLFQPNAGWDEKKYFELIRKKD